VVLLFSFIWCIEKQQGIHDKYQTERKPTGYRKDSIHNMNENKKKSAAIEHHRYNYNVMFLCICNCCSNVECNSNEEGRNGLNVWNLCYSFNLEIIRDYIYIYIYRERDVNHFLLALSSKSSDRNSSVIFRYKSIKHV
jgi:hypothetical protein